MAPSVKNRKLRTPRPRLKENRSGYFFPNEVVRILGLDSLDYRQIRRLFELVSRSQERVLKGKWARFTFQDLAAIRGAISALGGIEAVARARRLRLRPLELACALLRRDYGLDSPLTQARLRLDGSRVLVELRGARFRPETGQLLINLPDSVDAHLRVAGATESEKKTLLRLVVREAGAVRRDGLAPAREFTACETIPCITLDFRRNTRGSG